MIIWLLRRFILAIRFRSLLRWLSDSVQSALYLHLLQSFPTHPYSHHHHHHYHHHYHHQQQYPPCCHHHCHHHYHYRPCCHRNCHHYHQQYLLCCHHQHHCPQLLYFRLSLQIQLRYLLLVDHDSLHSRHYHPKLLIDHLWLPRQLHSLSHLLYLSHSLQSYFLHFQFPTLYF